jgi:hypothetical protein
VKELKPSFVILTLLALGCAPSQTSVELENNADGTLQVTVFFDDDQNILEDLLENQEQVSFTIPQGESRSFSRDCEDLQAVKVEADVQLVGGLGPSDSTGVFRDGSDFGCGDTLHFTFTSVAVPADLNIDFEVR